VKIMARRNWTDGELIVSIYLYRFGFEDLGLSYKQIADIFGRSPDSLFYRFANFLSMETDCGLKNAGSRAKQLFEVYGSMAKDELRKTALKMIIEHLKGPNDSNLIP